MFNGQETKMERYIWIGILSISFFFNIGYVSAQKPPSPGYAKIGCNKKSFLTKEETSIIEYRHILSFPLLGVVSFRYVERRFGQIIK
jgi:hypothetical protein